MPAENRVGRHDRGDVTKAPTAQPVSVHGQPRAVLIGEALPTAHVPTTRPFFGDPSSAEFSHPTGCQRARTQRSKLPDATPFQYLSIMTPAFQPHRIN
jgi:hypothetical protein